MPTTEKTLKDAREYLRMTDGGSRKTSALRQFLLTTPLRTPLELRTWTNDLWKVILNASDPGWERIGYRLQRIGPVGTTATGTTTTTIHEKSPPPQRGIAIGQGRMLGVFLAAVWLVNQSTRSRLESIQALGHPDL